MTGNPTDHNVFQEAEWYDRTIDWSARLHREIPVLIEVFGRGENGGLLDAGCGTGHHAVALARDGYRVVGADISESMLVLAKRNAADAGVQASFTLSSYAELPERVGTGFTGVYCLGNALAAAGSRPAVQEAVSAMSRCLRIGGRLFVQILNFGPMRREAPCVRGPRVTRVEGVEYLSVRHFQFTPVACDVTNITLWRADQWRVRAHAGVLYPVRCDEMHDFCRSCGLRVDDQWGNYTREPFDPERSSDLILTATRMR